MENQQTKPNLSSMAEKWPSAYVARERVGDFSGGILHPRTLANLDSLGAGPARIQVGRKIAYKVDDLINWMADRAIQRY